MFKLQLYFDFIHFFMGVDLFLLYVPQLVLKLVFSIDLDLVLLQFLFIDAFALQVFLLVNFEERFVQSCKNLLFAVKLLGVSLLLGLQLLLLQLEGFEGL